MLLCEPSPIPPRTPRLPRCTAAPQGTAGSRHPCRDIARELRYLDRSEVSRVQRPDASAPRATAPRQRLGVLRKELDMSTSSLGLGAPCMRWPRGSVRGWMMSMSCVDRPLALFDAWDRIIWVGSNEQFGYLPNSEEAAQSFCVCGPTTDSYYSINWQVLEDKQNTGCCGAMTTSSQYVWGIDYIDDLAERDDNSSSGNLGISGSGLGRRLYVQHDANWNITAITDTTGAVKERFIYDPYGTRTLLNASWSATSDGYTYLLCNVGVAFLLPSLVAEAADDASSGDDSGC